MGKCPLFSLAVVFGLFVKAISLPMSERLICVHFVRIIEEAQAKH